MGLVYDRLTKETYEDVQYGNKYLKFLYNHFLGRFFLKIIINPLFSRIVGKHYDSKKSTNKIDSFIEENHIDMSLFEDKEYDSFNDFFARKLKRLDFSAKDEDFISPATSKLLCYKIDENVRIKVKENIYDLDDIIKTEDNEFFSKFKNGNVLVFRLSVDDYHRYHYIDDGYLTDSYEIPGKLHTVSSISNKYKIFKINHRVVNLLETKNFDQIIYVEVGALLVGKIVNNDAEELLVRKSLNKGAVEFKKGQEKGYFKYGGSTIIVITKDVINIDEDILKNSENGIETKVRVRRNYWKK